MHELIARLICAGLPRKVAACVCADFQRRGKMIELAQYVDEVEKETSGYLEAVQ